MDIELLRTFLEVERLRHFGHAADALFVTQAAVSARNKQLERQVGARLFDRERREIRLTPAGARFTRYADRIISEWRKARHDIAAGGADNQLAFGGSLRLWDPLLQAWLCKLSRRFPHLALIAESHSPEVLTRRLLDGLLDVAFMLEPAQREALQIEPLPTIQLDLMSTDADATLDEALGKGFVMVDWGLSHALQHRRQFPDAPEPTLRFGQAKMAHSYIVQFGGAAYLPLGMMGDALVNGELHLVANAPSIEMHAYAVYPVRSARAEFIHSTLALFENDVETARTAGLRISRT